jgi:hypothetical protein
MRAFLGGGADLPALWLLSVWLLGLYGVPLQHALFHRFEGQAHCHGEVCHGGEGAPGATIRDGTLPDLGSLQLSHGDVLAVVTPPWPIARATLGLRAPQASSEPVQEASVERFGRARARGPPA